MSFELPDGKIARTMPEQVAKNASDIEELKTGYNQISNIAIESGRLVLTLEDGTSFDAGAVKGISSVSLDASKHLIVTYDDGTTSDLGLLKSVSSISINASQHLIVTYNDGSTQDLGAIFSGNVTISGNLTVTGQVAGNLTTSGHFSQGAVNYQRTFSFLTASGFSIDNVYNRCIVVNNVLYLIANIKITNQSGADAQLGTGYGDAGSCFFTLDHDVAQKIYDFNGDSAADVGSNYMLISSVPCICLKGQVEDQNLETVDTFRFSFVNRASADGVAVIFRTSQRITVPNNGSLILCARIALSLF